MTEQIKKCWTWCYMIAAITMIGFVMTGCVDVGSSSGGVEADTTSTSTSDQEQQPAE